jgi:hypothetical protein
MLDVHAPHKKLEGTKEFFFHLFTITIGLLIATQIESCMEWRHHVHLAAEAREKLRDEISHNVKDLEQAQPALDEWRKQVSDDISAMERIQQHPADTAAQEASITVSGHGMSLRNTAWKTAESTGALAYMPYDEALRYTEIYQAQAELAAVGQKPMEDMARAMGLVTKFGRPKRISPDQATALAEPFGQAAFHLADAAAILKKNIELNKAFLEGREPKGSFEENVR